VIALMNGKSLLAGELGSTPRPLVPGVGKFDRLLVPSLQGDRIQIWRLPSRLVPSEVSSPPA
jgi:hypothetical protein